MGTKHLHTQSKIASEKISQIIYTHTKTKKNQQNLQQEMVTKLYNFSTTNLRVRILSCSKNTTFGPFCKSRGAVQATSCTTLVRRRANCVAQNKMLPLLLQQTFATKSISDAQTRKVKPRQSWVGGLLVNWVILNHICYTFYPGCVLCIDQFASAPKRRRKFLAL